MSATRQLTPDEIANASPCAACDGLGYLHAAPATWTHDTHWQPETVPVTCWRCCGGGVERS